MTTEIGFDELAAAQEQGGYVVDVREPDEYAVGHVAGARLMPLGVVGVRLHELPTDQPIYVLCGSGARSAEATALMVAKGLDARSVAGGTAGWIGAGRAVETGL